MQVKSDSRPQGNTGLRVQARDSALTLVDGNGNNVVAMDCLDKRSRISFISHAHVDHVDRHDLGHFIASRGGNDNLILAS
nr:hypothetical protein [Candidatus Sigynarchaeota archaeon]